MSRGEATRSAEALGLRPMRRPRTWRGKREGFWYRIVADADSDEVWLYCAHKRSLRLGLGLYWTDLSFHDPLGDHPHIELGAPFLSSRMALHAVEAATASAIVLDAATELDHLSGYGAFMVDDRRVGVRLSFSPFAADILLVAAYVRRLSACLLAARVERGAEFEAAIAPSWSELAATHRLKWVPSRSMIRGEAHGASIEARVDGDPCCLYTEVHVKWLSLDRGLSIVRALPRGREGEQAPPLADPTRVGGAFARAFRGSFADLPRPAQHSALGMAAIGASLEIDDTGLVARLDRVVADAPTMTTLLGGALAIARSLMAPTASGGLYR